MLVVLVVNLEVGVSLLAPPVGHDVEWTGVGPGLRNYLVFQNINIEIGSLQVMQSSGCATLMQLSSMPHLWI